MKYLLFLIILFPFTITSGQKIGEVAKEKPLEIFPDNSWGVDIMFSDGGIGLGTFLRKALSDDLTALMDFSISESKDEKEIEYYDYWGNPYVVGKKNRVFLLPVNFGVQYSLFRETLTESLRPYLFVGAGPTMVVTTPYEDEFFKSFAKAHSQWAVGGYIGFGAYFGSSKTNLIGINMRYSLIHLFGEGVENLYGRFRNDLNRFYISLNIGIMY